MKSSFLKPTIGIPLARQNSTPFLKATKVGIVLILRESHKGLLSSDKSTVKSFNWEQSKVFRGRNDLRQ